MAQNWLDFRHLNEKSSPYPGQAPPPTPCPDRVTSLWPFSSLKVLLDATSRQGSFTKSQTDSLEMEVGVKFSSFQAMNSVLGTLTPKRLPGRWRSLRIRAGAWEQVSYVSGNKVGWGNLLRFFVWQLGVGRDEFIWFLAHRVGEDVSVSNIRDMGNHVF